MFSGGIESGCSSVFFVDLVYLFAHWTALVLKLKIKTPECRHWHCSGVYIVDFEHISHIS